jgi:hypothetical protein
MATFGASDNTEFYEQLKIISCSGKARTASNILSTYVFLMVFVKWVHCHHGMAWPWVSNSRDFLQM